LLEGYHGYQVQIHAQNVPLERPGAGMETGMLPESSFAFVRADFSLGERGGVVG
jgi:hypothetical protein